MTAYKYEVAISFAGEDRTFAEAVAKGLRDAGVDVFYDDFYAADLWGEDLSTKLRGVYHDSSQFCIMLISRHYVEKMWTIFERQQAIDRLIKEKGKAYVLPVRLDGYTGQVPGLSESIGHLSVRSDEHQKVVSMFIEKRNKSRKAVELQYDAQKMTDRLRQGHPQKHESDQSRPKCMLVPPSRFASLDDREKLVEKIDPVPDDPRTPNYHGTYAIRCELRNLGTGAALNLRITFRFPDGQATEPFELPPLAAQEIRGGENNPILISIPLDVPEYRIKHSLNRTDFEKITRMAWEIWLEYEDIHGKKFCTVHHKSPLKPWVTFINDYHEKHASDNVENILRKIRSQIAARETDLQRTYSKKLDQITAKHESGEGRLPQGFHLGAIQDMYFEYLRELTEYLWEIFTRYIERNVLRSDDLESLLLPEIENLWTGKKDGILRGWDNGPPISKEAAAKEFDNCKRLVLEKYRAKVDDFCMK